MAKSAFKPQKMLIEVLEQVVTGDKAFLLPQNGWLPSLAPMCRAF